MCLDFRGLHQGAGRGAAGVSRGDTCSHGTGEIASPNRSDSRLFLRFLGDGQNHATITHVCRDTSRYAVCIRALSGSSLGTRHQTKGIPDHFLGLSEGRQTNRRASVRCCSTANDQPELRETEALETRLRHLDPRLRKGASARCYSVNPLVGVLWVAVVRRPLLHSG